ncbi:electron transport complex subunit RsxD [Parathalassolituus penaei]|uniref:Ion-translocating oxidoreductase complex subunit D n=1 Tax=Parathalassolituus penaei TaxID=2997323 RepID=A0A9X3EA20_9GAMM|nr:electron transport complex subunit RsxD [Parathalassolituus penaei]MCY0963663.1 electron transport complex subunit RsxD [Parathalassolituus penaei]
MALLTLTSPHAHGRNSTSRVMMTVTLATVPGLLVTTALFGFGTLVNVVLAVVVAMLAEALVLRIRQRPLGFFLKDYSALLTGVLLGLALPPLAPWWVTVVATAFAIVFGKQLYGGMGNNPFNPAMLGYALVLVSFPVQMTTNWAVSSQMADQPLAGLLDAITTIFSGSGADAFTGATPLDTYKHLISNSTAVELQKLPTFNGWMAGGWEWVNIAYLVGGLFLVYRRIITWHIPVAMLAALSLCSIVLGWDPDMYTPVSLHLFTGATMLGAFFIATDPVSAATTPRGKLIYGAGVGILVYVIRTWGAYPDAVAFGVLLMNLAAPFIDAYTQPRTYGHEKARRGLTSKEAR